MRLSPLVLIGLVAGAGCGGGHTPLPPLGEALVVIDTDLPVPQLASRLRVDAYAEDGTWYASRDFGLPSPSDWPASFSMVSPDPNAGRVSTLRLRAYVDGKTRDYRGERFFARPTSADDPTAQAAFPDPPADLGPRLLGATGATLLLADVTPPTEPEPALAVDRLLLVGTTPGVRQSIRIVLRGACLGTMADVAHGTTCVDAENTRVPVTAPVGDPNLSRPTTNLVGTFAPQAPCTATPRAGSTAADGSRLFDEEVCVPGGAYVFGDAPVHGPERVAVVSPFLIDKYEVTVGRWRAALAAGLNAKTAITNDLPIPTTVANPYDQFNDPFCTYSSKPVGREAFPVECVGWVAARAFCKFAGGDLPTEAQWEYVAAAAGRPVKTGFPWGGSDDTVPDCRRAVTGRGWTDPNFRGDCVSTGWGPLGVDWADRPDGDVSVGLGVSGLGGDVAEWVLDTRETLDSNCWMSQPLHDPACTTSKDTLRSVRGAGWDQPSIDCYYGVRQGATTDEFVTTLGFRCARPGAP